MLESESGDNYFNRYRETGSFIWSRRNIIYTFHVLLLGI